MQAPPIVDGFSLAAVVPMLLAASTAWFFWRTVVPRQLQGLQVAFETGELRYEVHRVTTAQKTPRRCCGCLVCASVSRPICLRLSVS